MRRGRIDNAYDSIRNKILSGEYPPGFALMPELLAKDIAVSRTPVRDALRKLEAEGLVTIRPRLGASVKKMEMKEYREICVMRLALESYCAGLAAQNRTPADLAEIKRALKAMQQLVERIISGKARRSLRAELVQEDVRFHIAILSAARNQLMKDEILRLHLLNRVMSRPDLDAHVQTKAEVDQRLRAILAKHHDIHAAIEGGDFETAKKQMEDHLQEMIHHQFLAQARHESAVLVRELTPEEGADED